MAILHLNSSKYLTTQNARKILLKTKGKREVIYIYTANSIKVVLPKALTVNYERARDDGLLLVFTPKLGT